METFPPFVSAFATGLALCASLIVAIGAQNAFVLRQGLAGAHVVPVVALCSAADALLIATGVLGVGTAFAASPLLAGVASLAGAVFLLGYGGLALRRAWRPAPGADGLDAAGAAATASRGRVLAQAAAFTLLNPHVYLDTVLLAGSIGAQQPAAVRGWFVAGGACASVAWFSALGWGARRLSPWFASPRVWRVLDAAVGATMLSIAAGLVVRVVRG